MKYSLQPLTKKSSNLVRLLASLLLIFSISELSGQQLSMKVAKLRKPNPAASPQLKAFKMAVVRLSPAPAAPTITDFDPKTGGPGAIITITGTNFDNKTTISIGGVSVQPQLQSATQIVTVVGDGITGQIVVTNPKGTVTSSATFTLVAAPTISSIDKIKAGLSTDITVTGTNFVAPAYVTINNGSPLSALVVNSTTIKFSISGNPVIYSLTVNTPGGTASDDPKEAPQGNADLTLPDFGNGLTLIPTPSLDYTQTMRGKNWGFRERVWGNSLGVDSSLQKLGSKFLSPQVSVFGISGEYNLRMTDYTTNASLNLVVEGNFLVKKVSFFDTAAKTNTNFNPFVIHPRIGLVSTFFNDNAYIALYGNIPCILSNNDAFASFFKSGSKNVFIYPDFALGGMISLGNNGNQAIKLDLNLMVNNGEAQFMTSSTDKVIPFLKIGFMSTL